MKNIGWAVVVAIVAAGCAKDRVSSVNTPREAYISLGVNTTRAPVTYLSSIENDAQGFRVYGVAANVPDAWYDAGTGQVVDGTNNHSYHPVSGQWDFQTPVPWPAAPGAYPMTFYACYPASPPELTMHVPATPDSLTGTFTVYPSAAQQSDLLGAKTATGPIKPANGALSILFKHLLSKVNYSMQVESGYEASVQALGVKNVAGSRAYDFLAEDWTAASQPTPVECTYDFLYLGRLDDGREAIHADTSIFAGTSVSVPCYAPADSANLMLVPQQVPAQTWTPVSGQAPTTQAHVYLLYRLGKSSDPAEPDYIGYANASRHPGYPDSFLLTQNYTGELFVKVGYSFTLEWQKAKGYNYNIVLPGSSGGILIAPNYYDDQGEPTDLPVEHTTVGEPLLGDGNIHLVPQVDNWIDGADIPLN